MKNVTLKTSTEVAAEARRRIQNLCADEVFMELSYGALLVDLREPQEVRDEGTIPGAVNVPRGVLEFAADSSTPHYNPVFQRDARVILFCDAGARSALAAATLKDMGYTNVGNLEQGFRWWKEAGYPVYA